MAGSDRELFDLIAHQIRNELAIGIVYAAISHSGDP
jgi:hypothetical protein